MTSRLTGAFLLGSTAFLCAGEMDHGLLVEPPLMESAPSSDGICDAYKNIGKLYSDSDNPYIQSFTVFARFQYQAGFLEGSDANGRDFNYQSDEIRRHYAGAKLKFLNYFELSGQANIFDDDQPVGGNRGYTFEHLWDGYLKFDAGKAFNLQGLDGLKIGYGAREINVSAEWNVSSKNIKTVERSAISNKIWAYDSEFSNPTGAWLELAAGGWETQFGVFSTTQDDWIAGWDDGLLYYAKATRDLTAYTGADVSQFLWTAFYQDVESGDEVLAGGLEWATSLSLTYGRGPWQFIVEGIYGDNGDQVAGRGGDFWGFVLLPSMWLVEDRLEAVARYQYEGSEQAQGIRLNSRYARRADDDSTAVDLAGGRGNEHHSYYAGLNYYLCGNNAKVMAGIEYDDITSDGADVYSGWTTFVGFRTFF